MYTKYCLTVPALLLTTNIHFLYTRLPRALFEVPLTDVSIVQVEGGSVLVPSTLVKPSSGTPALDETVEAVGKADGDKSLKTAVDAFKREYIIRILSENGWNQTKAAAVLGIQRTYVIRLMNELHIERQ